jgi:nitrate/nitrite-specific signal transduction histidine kinase
MKKGGLILLLGLLLGTGAFSGIYYLGTASCRHMMNEPQPELAWLKREFNLGEEEFRKVSQLHGAYLPRCAERCRQIEEQNQRLQTLLHEAQTLTPEIQTVLTNRALMRAACEAEMWRHFIEVSRTMPVEQGRRYLAWVESQTFLSSQGMEQRHHASQPSDPHAGHSHH